MYNLFLCCCPFAFLLKMDIVFSFLMILFSSYSSRVIKASLHVSESTLSTHFGRICEGLVLISSIFYFYLMCVSKSKICLFYSEYSDILWLYLPFDRIVQSICVWNNYLIVRIWICHFSICFIYVLFLLYYFYLHCSFFLLLIDIFYCTI